METGDTEGGGRNSGFTKPVRARKHFCTPGSGLCGGQRKQPTLPGATAHSRESQTAESSRRNEHRDS